MDAYELEKRRRKFDADWKSVDDHNRSIEKSRMANAVDGLVEFNKYARPFVLGEMNGTPHRPYVTVENSNESYRKNYDMIDWGK